jgi:ComF family protein
LRGFDHAYCYGSYDGVLRQLIHLYKYGGIHPLSEPLAKILNDAFPRHQQFDCIVPVPLHWWKHWTRGFNQSSLLAKELGRRNGIPVIPALWRPRRTRTQAGLSNTARRRNVAAAFRGTSFFSVAGKRVLLIDDVMTTGATAAACANANALKRAGASKVTLLTLARVDRRIGIAGAPPPRHSSDGDF